MRPKPLLALACLTVACAGHPRLSSGPIEAAPTDPGVVTLTGALANKYVLAQQNGEVLARLRLDTRDLERIGRPPINLALVVDTSGSMEGEPIEAARAASLALVDSLAEGDRLAVIAFHSRTEVLVPSTRLDPTSLAAVRKRIAAMRATGTTDMAGGLQAGLDEVSRSFQQSGINRIVLIGDGVPNVQAPIVPLAQAAGQRGISITALGLGVEYDETLMGAVAQVSGGRFHYVKEPALVARVFSDEVLRLQRVIGRNLVLSLVPGPGVTILDVVGFPGGGSGARSISLGDLSEGEQRDVVVRLSVAGRRAGAVVELLDATVAFDDAVRNAGRLERHLFLAARATDDTAAIEAGRDIDVQRTAARLEAAAAVVDSISLARGGRLPEALSLIDGAERSARRAARSLDLPELALQADSMRPLRDSLPALAAEAARARMTAAPPATLTDSVPAAAPSIIRSSHGVASGILQGSR